MKSILVFEHTEYTGALEKEFYHFCVKRQFSLARYVFIYFLFSFLYFFRLITREKYYVMRWSFLSAVNNVQDKVNSFWKSRKRRLAHLVSGGGIIWISEYPEILLKDLLVRHGAELFANVYDIPDGAFKSFDDVYHIFKKLSIDEDYRIYDTYRSKLRKDQRPCFSIVLNKKIYKTSKRFLFYRILTEVYTFLALTVMGISLGLVSMYFGTGNYIMPMFLSYFKIPYLAFLNIFPVVFSIFLLYIVFNRVWASFLVTSVIIMLMTWIDYFKLLFREDPFMAADISLFSESMDMAGKYNLRLNWKIEDVIFVCIAITIAAFFLVKGKIRSFRIRLIVLILLAIVGVYSFSHIYMNTGLYNTTQNNSLINKWSGTQVFISRGYIYPFIYSVKSAINIAPDGYDEKEATKQLYSYGYSNIPGDKKVNIIGIQFEAFNDFSKFGQPKFNVDVYGYLHQLEAESYSGELVTNIFAGGTVDTERSFLTGFTSLRNFRSNVNSYVRYFEEQGYTAEGSHPCYGWFYNRLNINQYLGFQSYYFFENMYSQIANGTIARDNILFPQIIKLYEASKKTSKPYFSFNVTYQNHGPYSVKKYTDVQYVENQGYPTNEYNIMNNYFAGIYSTLKNLKQLVDYFRKEKDPVVVMLFGDHNPWMGNNNSIYKRLGIDFDLSTEQGFFNYYDTPYIIWGNDSAKQVLGNSLTGRGPKIGPYFLMNEFFNLAGYKGNEFLKASNELESAIDVVHAKGLYKESGVLTSSLSPEDGEKLAEFLKIQYYWSNNFRESSKTK